MKAIGIIGAGQMGAGIAQVSAQSGFQVFLADIGLPQAEAGKAKIAKQISRLVEKDKMDAKTAEALLDRIEPVADYAPLAAADLVIADATEREDIKRAILGEVGQVLGPQADRQSVVSGKSVSVRVDLGVCRVIKTKKTKN